MVLTTEGARALWRRYCCSASPPSASDGSHYEAFGACFMSVGVGCPSSPLSSSFVWWFEGAGGMLGSLHAYMCIRVCVHVNGKMKRLLEETVGTEKRSPFKFFLLCFLQKTVQQLDPHASPKQTFFRLGFQAVKPKKRSLCRRPWSQLMTLLLFHPPTSFTTVFLPGDDDMAAETGPLSQKLQR